MAYDVEMKQQMCCGVWEAGKMEAYAGPIIPLKRITRKTATTEQRVAGMLAGIYESAHTCEGEDEWGEDYDVEARFHGGAIVYTAVEGSIYDATNMRVRRLKWAEDVTAFIKEHALGQVTEAPAFSNPNTSNLVHIYVWTLNQATCLAWLLANNITGEWGD